MRTTLTLNDELLKKAQALTGVRGGSPLVREALKTLIEPQSARRLARPEANPIRRQRLGDGRSRCSPDRNTR